jgi:cell pole-organizing protein PopZ
MEEILDSIRRIIADEEPAKGATETPQGSAAAAREGADSQPPWSAAPPPQMTPRPMTPPRMTPAPAASSAPLRDEEINSMLSQLRGASRQAPPASEEQASTEQSRERPSGSAPGAQPRAIDEHGLLSAATTAAVGAAFDTLAQTAQARSGRTIEELVSELIRPMLKTWLDDNLPEMVERLVRAEIERLSRAKG